MTGRWLGAFVLACLPTLAGCGQGPSVSTCFPSEIRPFLASGPPAPAAPPAAGAPPAFHVYLDRSESMAGYLPRGREASALGEVIESLGDLREAASLSAIEARPFGLNVGAPVADARAFARREAYQCGGCDNRITRIDRVLNVIADRAAAGSAPQPSSRDLSMIITDLWQDDPALIAGEEITLGGPLRRLLDSGQAIGIIGIPSAFEGDVFFPQGPVLRNVRARRLLVILLVGPRQGIEAVHARLAASGSPRLAPDQLKFALFAPDRPRPARVQATAPAGTSQMVIGDPEVAALLPGIPQYVVEEGKSVQVSLDAMAGVPAHQLVSGERVQTSVLWRMSNNPDDMRSCGSQAWSRVGALPPGGWRRTGARIAYAFDLARGRGAGLRDGETYLIWVAAGTRSGGERDAPLNGAADWMGAQPEGWGGSLERARAAIATGRLPTPGLDRLRGLLEARLRAVSAGPQWRSNAAFLVSLR